MNNSIIVWNVRGIGTSRRRLKKLVSKFKPQLVAVLEPFQNVDKAIRLQHYLQFDSFSSNVDVGGKIWIFWANSLDIQVVRSNMQFVSLRVTSGSVQFLLNIIYAKCSMYERKIMWEDLSSQAMGPVPCLFAGDFNIIQNNSERRGGSPRSNAAMADFNDWIHQGGLVEMNSKGICSYLPKTTSDHAPMVIEFKLDPSSYGPSPFRFQQMWVDHPQFLPCVKQAWSATFDGHGLSKLAFKLKITKVALREWNKQNFGHTNMHIISLEKQIEELEKKLQQNWDDSTERDLIVASADLDNWLCREDTRLAQMAKLKWHMEGDRNTKFFHACLANKRCKKVMYMRSSNGMVFNSPEGIHQGAVDYFSSFLQGSQISLLPDLSTLISPIISDSDNLMLCGMPSMKEVYSALSSIPSNSSPGPD
ncbi:hypothetical protein F2P56_001492, partial [Juglans regia]